MIKIDKARTYCIGDYYYKNFATLSDDEIRLVWEWRNDARIREWMTNQEEIPFENHLRFIESLKTRTDKYYWLVYKGNMPIAVLDIIDIDYEKEESEPGYYLNPELLNSGEGLFFNYNFRSFLFNALGFQSVKGNIKVGNDRAYTMSTFNGVYAVGIDDFSDGEHLAMRGVKKDFQRLSDKHLLKDFVKYARTHQINWEELIAQLKDKKK